MASSTLFWIPTAYRRGHTASAARARYGRRSGTAPTIWIRGSRAARRRRAGGSARRSAAAPPVAGPRTDSDGTYPFEEIFRLLRHLGPEVDLVTASPDHPGGRIEGVPPWRQAFSFGASFLYPLILRTPVRTHTALFRAYRHQVLEAITVEADGYGAVAEIMAKALRAGFRVAEYPTALRVRRFGRSNNMKILRTVLAHLRLMAQLILPGAMGRVPARAPSRHPEMLR